MDVDSMKYAELQSLAKTLGLKANMKADKLLKAIKKLYEEETQGVKEQPQGRDACVASTQEDENADECKSDPSEPTKFVNTRRGRGNGMKRRIPDKETEADAPECPGVDEVDGKTSVSNSSCGPKTAKKTRVSSPKDSENSDKVLLPDSSSEQQQQLVTKGEESDKSNTTKVAKAGRIPRFTGHKKKKSLKPITPNFKKLHEAHFNKMESIDSYVQRKTKKMESYKNSLKEPKNAKSDPNSIFSPSLVKDRSTEDRRTVTAGKVVQKKAAGKEDAPFRPSVLSTRRITVQFSEATQDNEYKKSLVKTPSRMSLAVTSRTPQRLNTNGEKPNNTKTVSTIKTPGPFIFTGTSSTPGTQKKPIFDLKASLARPITYKPHTGKLRPFGEAKENIQGDKSLISNPRQKNYKQHQVQTREDRAAKRNNERKEKRERQLGARRGLVMM